MGGKWCEFFECIYCGEEFEAAEKNHWVTCPKHPAKIALDTARAEARDYRAELGRIKQRGYITDDMERRVKAVLAKYPQPRPKKKHTQKVKFLVEKHGEGCPSCNLNTFSSLLRAGCKLVLTGEYEVEE